MRTLMAWTLTMAFGAGAIGTASGQGTTPAPKRTPTANPTPAAKPASSNKAAQAAPIDPAAVKAQQLAYEKSRQEMNELLAEWEAQSKKVTSLDVAFDRIDKLGKAWNNVYYEGRAMLKSPDLACLEFKKLKLDDNGKPLNPRQVEKDPTERIVCTGTQVLQYEWDEQVIYVYPLEKEVRQKALQQGPLPFLFNMKAAEAKERYTMTLLPQQDEKERELYYLIAIVPQKEIDQQSFSKAFLWLNKKTFMPFRLTLLPVGNKELQEFRFNIIQANKALDDQMFHPSTKIDKWNTIYNPGGDGSQPAVGANPGVPRGPVAQPQPKRSVPQPAMRPGSRPQ